MKTGIGIVKMLERSGNQDDCNVWITFFGCWYSKCHCHGAKDYMGIKPSSVLRCSHEDLMFLIPRLESQINASMQLASNSIPFFSLNILFVNSCTLLETNRSHPGRHFLKMFFLFFGGIRFLVPWRVCSLCT